MTLTTTDLDRLEALEREATAAPWRQYGLGRVSCSCGSPLALLPLHGHDGIVVTDGNARFITETRNAASALIADLREARVLLAEAMGAGPWDDLATKYECRFCFVEKYPGPQFGEVSHWPFCLYIRANAFLTAAGVEVE